MIFNIYISQIYCQNKTAIIIILMIDLAISLLALAYFQVSSQGTNSGFSTALFLNIVLILSQFLVAIPTAIGILHSYSRSSSASFCERVQKYHLKSIAMSSCRMPIFCFLTICLGICCSYSVIAAVFQWKKFEYVFAMSCMAGCTLSDACLYIRIKCDFSSAYAVETFKFFMLILATIFFGISSSEKDLNTFTMGMWWLYFLLNSKVSLQKEVPYYLLVFLNITLLTTALFVLLLSKDEVEKLMGSSIWPFAALGFIAFQLWRESRELYVLYKNLSGGGTEYQKEDCNRNIQLYLKLHQLKNNSRNPANPEQLEEEAECSICMQQIKQLKEGLKLDCGHQFHQQCFEEWALINENCPNCRAHLSSSSD